MAPGFAGLYPHRAGRLPPRTPPCPVPRDRSVQERTGRDTGGGAPLGVCLVSAAYHPYPSGIGEHVSHLGAALADLGLTVEVLTTSYPGWPDDGEERVPVTRIGRARLIPLNGSYATLPQGRHLPRQVRDYFAARSFDVVHCHGVFWPEISYWAIRHSRALHVVSFLSAGFRATSVGGGLHRRLFARHLGRIHGRIALSRRARLTYAPYVPGPCRIVPSGVDTTRFRPDLEPLPEGARARPCVLFVGRMDRRKGLGVLLEAMPRVRREVPGSRLVVVGDGPGLARAVRRAADLGLGDGVAFAGRVSGRDLPRYYAGARAFCAPSLGGESFGIVLLEAMAAGVPVVASDIPGYDETVDDGRDGLLARPSDAAALAASVTRVLRDHDLAGRLIRAGLRKAEQHAWPRVAAATVRVYTELLAAPSG